MCEATLLLTNGAIFDLEEMKNAAAAIIGLQTVRTEEDSYDQVLGPKK